MYLRRFFELGLAAVALLATGVVSSAQTATVHGTVVKKHKKSLHARSGVAVRASTTYRRGRHRRFFFNPWTEPTYADSTLGDSAEGEDLIVRKAAVDALGPYNGTVVVADSQTGRILTMVNQKLALKVSRMNSASE